MLEKTLYVEGEKFDKEGIVVKAVYNNGNSEEISDYVLSGVDMSQIGTHQITVSYQGLTTTFDIEVIGKSLKNISATGVKKTEYMPGEKLDLTGLVVKAIYNNGTSSELSADDYTVSGYTGTVGNNIISVTYGVKSATFVVVVYNPSGEWVVTKEATCTSEGEKVQYCKDCDKELYREKIEKKAHTLVKDVAVDATCTTPGKTEGTHCSVCGEVIVKQDEIPALGHSFGDWEIVSKATCENAGELKRVCSVCGAEETKKDPATVTMSKNSFVYSGKVQRPSIAVKDSKGRIIPSAGYTITYSKGCKAVGKYALKLTFKGNYRGTINRTYTIVPKATSISSVLSGKKTFTINWKKQTTESSGYEVQYATASSFKGAKTVAVTSSKITSKKIAAVTSKRKYYVRVRAYKKVGNTKYYSAWSGVKTVVVK